MRKKQISAPVALKRPYKMKAHDLDRTDDYYWMRLSDEQKTAEQPDVHTQEVIAYLNAENNYYDSLTEHTKSFKDQLFQEIKSRIKEDDESVPYKDNGYFYMTRFKKGNQYPIYIRKKESLSAPEEIIFDVNKMAEGHDYFSLNGLNISDDNKVAAFGIDTVSRRQYLLQFKNLETGELYPEQIENTTGGVAWAANNTSVFYTKKDPVTLRSYKIFRHELGTDPKQDVAVFHEEDETFRTFVYKTKSKAYIVIGSDATLTSEYRVLKSSTPKDAFKIIQKRQRGLEYSISHYRDHFYIFTNKDEAENFKLMKTPLGNTSMEHWEEVIAHRSDVFLESFSLFNDYLVLEERFRGLNRIRIKSWDNRLDYYIPFEEETYSAGVYTNPDFDTQTLRYAYNSMTTPASVIDFNMENQSKEVKKEQEVLGGTFDKTNYTGERIWIKARDKKKVAVSLVYRNDTKLDRDTPLLLYAYGSYGHTISDGFSTSRLSLLDRGFVYAIAHIRGSQYLGRAWYEDGKLFNKLNTFNDFVDCSKGLIEKGYTSSNHLYAMGGSAGGLLMGVILNTNPDLYHGVIAAVPFVDVITTMLDETIPLTTFEYDEWGNPNDKAFYDYMLSYSPYDNVKEQDYPHILVTTGLHDSQVQYYEPAKWVAKLRALKKNDNLLLMNTNMDAGHGGASGRFNSLKETAKEFAFILDLEGIKK